MNRVLWSNEAELALLRMTPADAELVYAAVDRLARSERGFVRNMLDGSELYGLYTSKYVVLFDRDDTTIRVASIRVRRKRG